MYVDYRLIPVQHHDRTEQQIHNTAPPEPREISLYAVGYDSPLCELTHGDMCISSYIFMTTSTDAKDLLLLGEQHLVRKLGVVFLVDVVHGLEALDISYSRQVDGSSTTYCQTGHRLAWMAATLRSRRPS